MLIKNLAYTAMATLVFCSSCHNEHEKHHELDREFQITSPLIVDTIVEKDYVAQIRSINHIELRALEKGYIQNVYVDEGQIVHKGQLLFKIQPNIYEADVNSAKAEVKYAEIEYQNAKNLAEKNIIAPQEEAMALAKYQKAQAELASMVTHLKFTEIRAPFDGMIGKLEVRKGSLVDEGELLTALADNSKMWVYFNVPETEYLNQMESAGINKKMEVSLKMANGKYFQQKGTVETIIADFNAETGNIAYRATFNNPNALLRYGQTGNIVIPTRYNQAMLIPQKATFEELEKKYVFVIDKDNLVKAREIEIEAELPHIYIVKTGLKQDDRILLNGLRLVEENKKIKTKFEDPKKVLSNLDLYAE